eukprot:899921-Karenia_brevis.AAC.1
MRQLAPELESCISGKAARMIQPRRGQNEIVPEYKTIWKEPGDVHPDAQKGDIIQASFGLAKVLSTNNTGGSSGGRSTLELGALWRKQEFISEAMGVVHPFDRQIKIPTRVARVMHEIAAARPSQTIKFRSDAIMHYRR